MPLETVTSSQSTVATLGAGDHRCPTRTGMAPSPALLNVMATQEDAPLVTAVGSASATVSRTLTTRCAISVHAPLLPALAAAARSQQTKGKKKSFAPGCVQCRLAADVSQVSETMSSLGVVRRIKTQLTVPVA
jgi:hypothetical protein